MRKTYLLNMTFLLPALVFLLLFFVGPLVNLFTSSTSGGQGFQTFLALLKNPTFRTIIFNTVSTGFWVTVVTLLVAFPIAWFITIAQPRTAKIVFGVIIVSMWTSLLARLFSLALLYKATGPVNQLLLWTGLISQPIQMMHNSVGLMIGMFSTMLPFMVLPIYNTMSKIDPALMQAASICGARGFTIFRSVLLPLCMPGVSTGCVIVFVTAMGYFIVPAVLGGPNDLMLAGFIVEQIQQFLNWGVGTTAAIYLLLLTIVMYVAYVSLLGATRRERRS